VASSGAGDCVFALDTSAANALTVPFLAQINTPGCGITVNSNSASALSGFLGFFTARTIGVVGNWSSCFLCSFSPTPVNLPAPANDPLAYLPKPAVAACAGTAKNITGPGTYLVNPALGCYNVNITGSVGTNVTLMPGEYGSILINSLVAPSVVFQPGVYVIQGAGGLNLTGAGAGMSGAGVTIYMGPSAGSLTVNGIANTLNFTAPITGTYAGILFFQDPANTNPACVGGCSGSLTGLLNFAVIQGSLYFPKATLTFNGCCQSTAYTITVADKLSFTFDYFGDDYSSLPGGSPIKRTLLVE
jgi:hypothetical protein